MLCNAHTTTKKQKDDGFSMVVESTVIFSLINHDAKSPSLLKYTTSSTNTKRRLCTAKRTKKAAEDENRRPTLKQTVVKKEKYDTY